MKKVKFFTLVLVLIASLFLFNANLQKADALSCTYEECTETYDGGDCDSCYSSETCIGGACYECEDTTETCSSGDDWCSHTQECSRYYSSQPSCGDSGCEYDSYYETDNSCTSECGSEETCESGSCVESCTSQDYKSCYNGDVYWYDSCDNRGDKAESCSNYCDGGECVECRDRGDCPWDDLCCDGQCSDCPGWAIFNGNAETGCGPYSDECDENATYYDYSCSAGACTKSTTSNASQCERDTDGNSCNDCGECQNGDCEATNETQSCSESCSYNYCDEGDCKEETKTESGERDCSLDGTWSFCDANPDCPSDECSNNEDCCQPQDYKDCYNGDVYWYDSCGNRENLITNCEANFGDRSFCNSGECQSIPEAYDLKTNSLEPEDYCGEDEPIINLDWKYRSQTNDNQTAYRLQISTQDNFGYILRDTNKTSCNHPCENNYMPSDLSFNTTYHWRVKVWDVNSDENGESEWFRSQFTTEPKRADVDFSWSPEDPYSEEKVSFTNETEQGSFEIEDWYWTFEDGDPNESSEENPEVEFTEEGNKTVTLEAVDEEGVTCSKSKELSLGRELPDWQETGVLNKIFKTMAGFLKLFGVK